jgi:L-cysteine/cystine lyase
MSTKTDAKVEAIRSQLPAVHGKAYLNTGTNGPIPKVAADAMAEMARAEFEEGRINMAGWMAKFEVRDATREIVAQAFDVPTSEIALTQLTTEGMNIMIHGIDWQRGDEVIITNLEHPGGQLPLYVVARRYGVRIKLADLGVGDGDVAGKIEKLIGKRTRALIISHVAWNTGAVLPLKEIVVLVDGAQSAGHIDMKLHEVDADGYAVPGQKWMCGPEGTGTLWVSESRLSLFEQTYVNYFNAMGGFDFAGGHFLPTPGAARYDRIATYFPLIAGQKAATEWLVNEVGLDWARTRIKALGELAHDTLSNIDGVSVITPKTNMAGLVSFNLDGVTPDDLVKGLDERGFTLRTIHGPDCVRLATGFYNTEEEIRDLGAAIEEIRKEN